MKPMILNVDYSNYLLDEIGLGGEPSLNASVAKVMIQKSAAHAQLAHPKLSPQTEDTSSKAMDKGAIIHALLLGKGKQVYVVHADNYRTKAAQEERDRAREAGLIPLLADEAQDIEQAAMNISRGIASLGFDLDEGVSEFGIAWKSDEGVLCRRSLDKWTESKLQVIELKSIFCAHPDTCANQALRLGMDIEYAASLDAIYSLFPDLAGKVEFVFIFFELDPPHCVTALVPDGTFTTLGINKWTRAKEQWKECLKSGFWPGYLQTVGRLSAPQWALMRDMEDVI